MRQHEAVIKVMEENDGFATLGFLYQAVMRVSGCEWKTKTPFATIRRIVQDDRFFFRIRPGLWALKSNKTEIEKRFHLDGDSATQSAFNHAYFQGLLVEIGNMKGFGTFVPSQDQNRTFLGTPLKDIATAPNLYPFTYDRILRRVRTIDVVWFNSREFPQSFFEVEYTTDMQTSLLKFVDLQDFHSDFYIVSDKVRKNEFDGKLNYEAFRSIGDRVRFADYDHIAGLHTRISELQQYRSLGSL